MKPFYLKLLIDSGDLEEAADDLFITCLTSKFLPLFMVALKSQ